MFALTRSSASQSELRHPGATPVSGNLDGRAPLALPAVDAIVYAAAHFRFGGPRRPLFQTNVEGTKAILAAAAKAGAKTFVYVGAAGVIMDDRGSATRNADETAPTHPNSFSAYLASEAQGEVAVLDANRSDFRNIALRPPVIWGRVTRFAAKSRVP